MTRLALAALGALLLTACSSRVPADELAGSYEASYPFGSSTLVLNADGTFVQEVTVKGQGSATARGTWRFDAARSTLSLHGVMDVVDPYGDILQDWRVVSDEPYVAVDQYWWRVNLVVCKEYPYIKR